MGPVSLVVIVRDGVADLPVCLGSVRGFVGEAVVADTGSVDQTRAVAAGLGARVVDAPWADSFAAARNAALDHAAGDWVLWLDADDRLDPDNVKKLAALFATLRDENAAYTMTTVSAADDGTTTAVEHVRLFRRHPRHRWRYRVHEQILPSLLETGTTIRRTDVVIRHTGYADPAVRRRKLDRDLRLLLMQAADTPADPFVRFYLGAVYAEQGRWADAVPELAACLSAPHPPATAPKAYSLLAQCHRRLGDRPRADAALRAGRAVSPDDPELLLLAANLAKEAGDPRGAEHLLLRLLHGPDDRPLGYAVEDGLRTYKARHNLAVLSFEYGRPADAEARWRDALAEAPGYVPALLGLGELHLRTGHRTGVDAVLAALAGLGPRAAPDAAVLAGRALAARGDLPSARVALAAAADRFPDSLPAWLALSHAHLVAGGDRAAAERALRAVLALDPTHPQARHNLNLLGRP